MSKGRNIRRSRCEKLGETGERTCGEAGVRNLEKHLNKSLRDNKKVIGDYAGKVFI